MLARFARTAARPALWRAPRAALSYPAHEVVGLPALSPTMEQGTIAAWKVDEGGAFGAGDVIAEIETDKATVDFEAQDDGVLAKILVPAGTEVAVGAPVMVVVEDEGDAAAFGDFVAPAAAAAAPPAPAPAPEPAAAPPAAAAAPAAAAPPAAAAAAAGARVVASPLARKEAAAAGVDLSLVAGTGPGGRVTADDVRFFEPPAAAEVASAAPAAVAGAGYAEYAVSPASAAIAAKLAHSMQTAPHYYLTMDCDVGAALALLDSLNASLGDAAPVGLYDLMIKASASATKAVPAVNASWLEPGVVRQYARFDVNVVSGVGEGLAAPALVDVGALGLGDIAAFTAAAPEADEPYVAGTFTIQNLGAFGVASAAPIVHTPQACALALGAVRDDVALGDDGALLAKPTLTCTLAADHRVVDGAVGAQWLAALKGLVENPTTLLL